MKKAKVSPRALAKNNSICSAAGAIKVLNHFIQSDATLTIANSFSEKGGGTVLLGAPLGEFRDVVPAGFEAVVGSF